MDWRPENEVEEEEKEQGKRIMLRDEACSIIMSMIEAQVTRKVDIDEAVDAAIINAPKVLRFLDDKTPF